MWSPVCPVSLRPMLRTKQYAELASVITNTMKWKWNSLECISIALMYIFVPAHASQFLVINYLTCDVDLVIVSAKQTAYSSTIADGHLRQI